MKKIVLCTALLISSHQLLAKTIMKTPEGICKGSVPLDGQMPQQLSLKPVKKIGPTLTEQFEQAAQAITNNNLEEAIRIYDTIIKEFPYCAQAYLNRGVIAAEQGKYADALADYQRALTIKPDYFKALLYSGQAHKALSEYDAAIPFYTQALALEPERTEIHKDLALIYIEKEKFMQAVEHTNKVLEKDPDNRTLLFQLGNLYNLTHRSEKSLEIYYKLLVQSPQNPSLLYNVGYTLKHLNKIDEAIPFYKATIENPQASSKLYAEAHFSLGLLHLTKGDFEEGWALYEWRWNREDDMKPRNLGKPQWNGSDLRGKTLFIHAEQGLGDTYQFIRFAEVIKKKYRGRVVVAVQDTLYDIISLCPYIDQVTKLSQSIPYFDEHIPLLSIPYAIKLTVDTVPQNIPYLYADEGLVQQWKNALAEDTNFKIGLCYQGNTKYSTPYLRAAVAAKSLPLEHFASFSNMPGLSIYCLQKDTGVEQLESADWNLITFDDAFDQTHGRFMDTAALMKNLDLVITMDTSIAHLAGGLGVPVWVLLPNPADWRWMLNRIDTPWYPTMRLWRQGKPGDWQLVIHEMMIELQQLLHTRTTTHIRASKTPEELAIEREAVRRQMEIIVQQLSENCSRDPLYIQLVERLKLYHALNEHNAQLDEQINHAQQKQQ